MRNTAIVFFFDIVPLILLQKFLHDGRGGKVASDIECCAAHIKDAVYADDEGDPSAGTPRLARMVASTTSPTPGVAGVPIEAPTVVSIRITISPKLRSIPKI